MERSGIQEESFLARAGGWAGTQLLLCAASGSNTSSSHEQCLVESRHRQWKRQTWRTPPCFEVSG